MKRAIGAILLMTACANGRSDTPAFAGTTDNGSGPTRVAVERTIVKACDVDSTRSFFELDEAKIKEDDGRTLARIADCLANGNLRGRNVRIVGYADPKGTEGYNKQLGAARAESVASYLESKGVLPNKIIKRSRGEEYATGKDTRGFAFDRRVDISLAD